MSLPPLLESRAPVTKLALTVVAPIVLGAVTGACLGTSQVAYTALNVVASIGGVLAGLEHRRTRGAMARGLVGGACFGGSILVVHALAATPALAKIPEPAILLLAFTVTGGVVLGAIGSRVRTWLEQRRSATLAESGA